MESTKRPDRIRLAFITDKSPIIDIICNDLVASGLKILFRADNIDDGVAQLFTLQELPDACIIDLDFYEHKVLKQLRELKSQHPSIRLIAHSGIDDNEIANTLFEIGIESYLLLGSDANNFINAIKRNKFF